MPMTVNLKVPFATDECGRVVDIRDLSDKCAGPFSCASCKGRVISRRGPERIWHFSHTAQSHCSDSAAFESALHLLAKQILLNSRLLRTPALVCRYWPSASTSDIVVAEEHVNRRDSPGQLEQWFQGVRPDFTV
ncbi:competence protein CoiA family protein, partial [Paraburkholderia elongata]|nr:hypothetical protein [Paraburkholderia elongata]